MQIYLRVFVPPAVPMHAKFTIKVEIQLALARKNINKYTFFVLLV